MTIRKEVYEKHLKSVAAGNIVFNEGEAGEEMYIIVQGEVEISKRTSVDSSKTLIILKPGDIFGEMSIIEKKPRSATAIALRDSRLLQMDTPLFFSMIEKNPDFAVKVVKILSERIRRSNHIIQTLSSSNKESFVLSGLRDYAIANGIDSIKGKRVSRDKFILWATGHIGLAEKEVTEGIVSLLGHNVIAPGAGRGEIIVPLSKLKA